jgi:hypothetical protein
VGRYVREKKKSTLACMQSDSSVTPLPTCFWPNAYSSVLTDFGQAGGKVVEANWHSRAPTTDYTLTCAAVHAFTSACLCFLQARPMTHAGFMFPVATGTNVDAIMRN